MGFLIKTRFLESWRIYSFKVKKLFTWRLLVIRFTILMMMTMHTSPNIKYRKTHEGVHNSNSTNSIQDSALVICMKNYALIQANHVVVDGIKSKSQVVTCLVGDWFVETKRSTTKIGYIDKNNLFYICLLFVYVKIKDAKFHQWKRKKK